MDGIAELAELVFRETGIVLSAAQETSLREAVDRAAPGAEPRAFFRAASDPVRGRALVGRLIDEVTIKETTFLRDPCQLDAISWNSLVQGARENGSDTIRVWSAGSATGEEPYTLALLASEYFAPAEPPVDVLGTDVSGAALAAATVGSYRERAVRGLSEPQRRRYFDRQADGRYLVGDRLRRLVRFSRHNLARDPFPPSGEARFDLIACRNVLIYFEAPLIRTVIGLFEGSLRPGGMLMVGAADALSTTAARLAALAAPGTAAPGTAAPEQATLETAAPDPAAPETAALDPAAPGPAAQRPARPLRRPLTPQPPLSRDQRLSEALKAAGKGASAEALAHAASLLAENPLDADAYFLHGLVTLETGNPARAVASLRRALYADAAFALAAFTLGRAHDALGDAAAARRAYEQALRTLNPNDHRHDLMLQQVDIGDVAAACRVRLSGRA
jgi:chemotaxis protein methyltransferase CheR